MAHYTMELHRAIEFMGGRIEFPGEGDNNTDYTRVIGGRIPFNTYPIFDEEYRKRLNGLIIDTFYLHEIAHETPEIFMMRFRQTMQLHMPNFNKMYELGLVELDPLKTVDVRTVTEMVGREDRNTENTGTASAQTDGTSATQTDGTSVTTAEHSDISTLDKESETTAQSHANSKARAVNSDYPQHMLAGDEDYASTGADTNSQNETDSTGTGKDTQRSTNTASDASDSTTHQESTGETHDTTTSETHDTGKLEADTKQDSDTHRSGYEAYGPELIARYRETLANIDAMVIEKLKPLFFGLWQNNDTYTHKGYYYYGA